MLKKHWRGWWLALVCITSTWVSSAGSVELACILVSLHECQIYSCSLLEGWLSDSADTSQVVCVKVFCLNGIIPEPPRARVGQWPLITTEHEPASGQDSPTFVLILAACTPLKRIMNFFLFFFLQQGNIFIVDYELLDGVDANKTDPCTIQYLTAPICLLYKNLESKIVPIAIQVGLLSGSLKGHTACSLISNVTDLGFCVLFISFSLVNSLGQTIPYSFLQMPHMTGC